VPSIAAAIVVDMNSSEILYSQAPDTQRAPASLTKMMTLYVLFSYLRAGKIAYNSELAVTPYAASQAPTKLGLKPDTTIRTIDAIDALVTQSANDAAVAIAENLAGTEENFASVMTQRAKSIGMSNTLFRNASGLPNPEQVTTARDMAILAQHLIHDFPEYYPVFETKYFSYAGRRYRNHNHLLFGYKGTDGIKTGYTRASGFNLTASVHRDNKHLVAVVLGGKTGGQRDAAMRALLDRYMPQAVAATSAPRPLVAQAEIPPAPKQPVMAMAAPAPVIEPVAFGKEAAPERSEPVKVNEPIQASVPPLQQADPIITGRGKPTGRTGDFHVQVGAFTSETEAESRLGQVKGRATNLLEGHEPVTTTFHKNTEQWYRARFAGFSQDAAKSTCASLKKMALDCVVMRAE
jgi:D-alanyl-D-alanine carboxypeptidase